MIPVLFESNATSFNTNGIGRLIDCLSCEVVEERNGEYSLELIYPTSGQFYDEIKTSRIILAKPNYEQPHQAFRIYKISKPINQLVTVNANHLSYDLNYIPVDIFNATGINGALNGLKTNSLENNPFNFITDIENTEALFQVSKPKSVRACLGGEEGSIMQTFSGSAGVEYKWDNYDIYVTLHRGSDNGVQLRYGKNITDLNYIENIEETITGVLPIWTNPEGTSTLAGDIQYSPYKLNYPFNRTVVLDCSEQFEDTPTLSELNDYAFEYVSLQGLPKENIKISFIDLSKTDEYKFSVGIETINLCDEVNVIYQPLGITYKAKVIKTVYDVLTEKYLEIIIGDARSSLAKTLITTIEQVNNTSDKLASVNIKVNQQEGSLGVLAQQVDSNNNKLIHLQVDSTKEEVRVTNQTSEQPTSYTSFKGDGMRIFVDNTNVAEATADRFNCNKGLGVQDWAIEEGSNVNILNIYRKE
jgi:phage minor structural protein